jgi:hypothetical protein
MVVFGYILCVGVGSSASMFARGEAVSLLVLPIAVAFAQHGLSMAWPNAEFWASHLRMHALRISAHFW